MNIEDSGEGRKNRRQMFAQLVLICVLFLCVCVPIKMVRAAVINAKYSVTRYFNQKRAEKLMDDCDDFLRRSTDLADILYRSADEKYVNAALSTVNTYYPLLARDLGLDAKQKLSIIMYPEKSMMYRALQYKETGALAPMGAYTAGIIVVLSPRYWQDTSKCDADLVDTFFSDGPIIHEMAHLLTDNKAKGTAPTWLSEGLALYYENKYTGYVWQGGTSKPMKYKDLANFDPSQIRESYRKSYEVVAYMENNYGMTKILERLRSGERLNYIMKEAVGNCEELDAL